MCLLVRCDEGIILRHDKENRKANDRLLIMRAHLHGHFPEINRWLATNLGSRGFLFCSLLIIDDFDQNRGRKSQSQAIRTLERGSTYHALSTAISVIIYRYNELVLHVLLLPLR